MELVNGAVITNVYSNGFIEARVWMTHWASGSFRGACQWCSYNKCIFQWVHRGSCVDDTLGLGELSWRLSMAQI